MIWWLVDNANTVYLLLGLALVGAALLFAQTKRGRELLAMGIIIVLGVLFWLMCSRVMTDRKQVEANMRALADCALENRPDRVAPLLAKDFRHGGLTREQMGAWVTEQARAAGVSNYNISSFEVEKLDQGKAHVTFLLRVDHSNGIASFRCKALFVMEEKQWRLQAFDVRNPFVDADKPLTAPAFE